jgi:hypothetical protein
MPFKLEESPMSNEFHGTGIALSDAILTTIRVDGEARKVAWLPVKFNDHDGDFDTSRPDEAGFSLNVVVSGEGERRGVARRFKRGHLVSVEGYLSQTRWVAATGEKRSGMLLNARRVTHGLVVVDFHEFLKMKFPERSS